jgi:hypothetical protein
MRLKPKQAWFLAFTAVFAAAAGFVFWGAWALDVAPVMPDAATSFSVEWATDLFRNWCERGKFVPGDLATFLGGPYFWTELRYAFAAYCAALGLAYFLRGRGLGRLASYGAGLLLAFSGYWFTLFSAGHFGWFQWMTYGVFAFGLIDRALSKGRLRHWILLGAVVAWASFYQPDLWLLFSLFTFVYFVWRSAMSRPGWGRWLKGSAVALAVFALIGGPAIWNAAVVDTASRDKQIDAGETLGAKSGDDKDGRWEFVTNWSMPPEDTLEFFRAGIHGDTSCMMTLAIGGSRKNGIEPYSGRLGRPLMRTCSGCRPPTKLDWSVTRCPKCGTDFSKAPPVNYRQHSLYVGWVTCLFALLGAVLAFKTRKFRADAAFFLAAGLVFWVFSMGRFCEPAYRLVFALPMGDYIRAPVKWHHLTEFCIAVLAGFGVESLLRLFAEKGGVIAKRGRLALAVLVLWGVADLAKEDSLFCAPHMADADIAPLQQPIPESQADAQRFYAAIRSRGWRVLGKATVPVTVPVRGGVEVRGADIPVIEVAHPRPKPREVPPSMPRGLFAASVASAAASLLALAYAALAASSRKIDGVRV